MIKFILGLLLVAQSLALKALHLNTGSSAMKGADTSSLVWFIVIGVVAFIIIFVIICCLFKQNPEYRDSYIQKGGNYTPNGYYENNPGNFNNYNPNPYNNPGYYGH